MHQDELRDQDTHHRHLLADLLSNPDSLHTQYSQLLERDRLLSRRVEELERELQHLQSEGGKRASLAAQVSDLTRRLGTAHGALEAYRAESKRLKGDLARLRNSRAVRWSRKLSAPARAIKPARSSSVEESGSAPGQGKLSKGPAPQTADDVGIDKRDIWVKQPSQCTYEELKQRLAERPSSTELGYVLNRAWFNHGLVEEPARLIDDHPEEAQALAGPAKALAERILGGRRLRQADEWIPARSPGTAYLAERGRLMYCVHSTPIYNSNGYSTRTRGVASALQANGIDVRVVGRAGYPWDAKTDIPAPAPRRSASSLNDVDYVHLTGPHEHRDPQDWIVLQMADAFVREARLYRPSMIQAASNYRTGLAALIAARRLGVPFVYEVRGLWELTEASTKPGWEDGDRYRITKQLETLVATEADHVLAITREVADELIARGVDAERITLLPNGVDPDQFTPLYADPEFRQLIPPHPSGQKNLPSIGFAGSMVDYEGLDDLLEASALLHDQGVLHHVLLAGSGPAEPRLRKIVDSRGMDHVTFLGRLPSDHIPRLLTLLDVVVCPRKSTLITELVSPLKPLEAMGAGRAVILSDVAPNRAIAGSDETRALLHRADDPEDLARQLAPLLTDPDQRRGLGRHARRWVLRERTWGLLGQQIATAHGAAAAFATAREDAAPSIALEDLRVGVVADEFTTKTLAAEVRVTSLDRDRWADQLDSARPHLVFIESAWANNNAWHRGIGYYSDEEHADFRALIETCRASGIPTVFWNKEDPVHFNRFVRAAAECDHVFTTDANMIPKYLAAATQAKTASALPFYAAPTIHNPLPGSLPPVGGTSYAGTFYGERYAERSRELERLLNEAAPFGLTIFDRQAVNPDSPYRFPPHLQKYVVGSLPYDQVLDAYKAHTANLNVNSVTDSPSMFSRRVVEVAASGAVALSAPGRGVSETFGDAIAGSDDPHDWRAWLRAWSSSPETRREEAWLQMRTVLRAHTAGTALTLVARTAGLAIRGPMIQHYEAVLHGGQDVLKAVAKQSVLPTSIHVLEGVEAPDGLLPAEIKISHGLPDGPGPRPRIHFHLPPDRVTAEDLLHATKWGDWSWISTSRDLSPRPPYARPSTEAAPAIGVVLVNEMEKSAQPGLVLSRPWSAVEDSSAQDHKKKREPALRGKRLLVAGHDLKFAKHLISAAEEAGAEVLVDQWTSHSTHDEDQSTKLLNEADVVFCEWGLGNAVWYSQHLHPHQRMVVRVHAQELRRNFLRRIDHARVDTFIFVGRTILDSAVAGHGIPRAAAVVVPNPVDVEGLDLPKTGPAARHTLGLVGAIPRSKRPDLALDLLELLRIRDDRYTLRIKGHGPGHYPWLANLPEEIAYYDELQARIDAINAEQPGAVIWDPHGDDMAEWFRQIGVALSVSDHESFHYTVADGAASGALPAVLAWPGAEYLYPEEWLAVDLDELADRIRTAEPSAGDSEIIRDRFGADVVIPALLQEVVFGRTLSKR